MASRRIIPSSSTTRRGINLLQPFSARLPFPSAPPPRLAAAAATVPATRRYESSSIPKIPKSSSEPGDGPPPGVSAPASGEEHLRAERRRAEPAAASLPEHSTLDYEVHVDKATSTFTPVPRRVQDGSEPGEALPAAVLSGAPMELQARTVRIYQPAKSATQSGAWGSRRWRMDWDVLGKGHRWENPLMGWQSSGDFMQGTGLHFGTLEDAVAFAEKQGYEYFVQQPQERKFMPKAYANNYLYSPGKLKHIQTK